MEYHYKAFISYRHAELDTKVAVEIQNRIERFYQRPQRQYQERDH